MMNFKIFNPELVNIVILPHSKGGQKSQDQVSENIEYCERLKEKAPHHPGFPLNNNVVIIDGVHSGTGILALESALEHCFPSIKVYKIAINVNEGIAEIPVNEVIVLPCEPKFSDVFPRLVTAFRPQDFKDKSKFITNFIDVETNHVAEMIIDIARDFPEVHVENTEWYKLNNEITEEIALLKEQLAAEERRLEELRRIAEEARVQSGLQEGYFKPIVLTNPKRYKCPICKKITGTAVLSNPEDTSLFTHNYDCPNKSKIPQE
jgi:hypothetical protein